MEKELYKSRSVSACIKDGYVLFCSNIATIVRRNWLPILSLSTIWGIQTAWNLQQMPHPNITKGAAILSFLFAILLPCTMMWYTAATTDMLNKNGRRRNLLRNARLMLFALGIAVIVFLIGWGLQVLLPMTQVLEKTGEPIAIPRNIVITATVYLLLFVCLLPFSYSSMKYIHEERAHFTSHVLAGYATGFRYIGFIVSVVFLVSIMMLIVVGLAGIPLMILALSNQLTEAGLAAGDPSTLPAYFTALLYSVSILVGFILTALVTIEIYICYYIYGSIEARRTDQNKRKQIQSETQNL